MGGGKNEMDKETKMDIIELGRGYLGVFILALVMYLKFTSAMYAGDSYSFQTNITNPVYTVNGNSSSLQGLNITFENGNITITPVINYKPDNFTLVFMDNLTREVIKTYKVGGGTRTKYVDNNVTIYVPKYINETVEVEIEKVINTIEYIEDEYALKNWHVIFAMFVGGLFIWFIMRVKQE